MIVGRAPAPRDVEAATVLAELTAGRVRAAEPDESSPDGWRVRPEVKAAILACFTDPTTTTWQVGPFRFRDRKATAGAKPAKSGKPLQLTCRARKSFIRAKEPNGLRVCVTGYMTGARKRGKREHDFQQAPACVWHFRHRHRHGAGCRHAGPSAGHINGPGARGRCRGWLNSYPHRRKYRT